MIPHNKPSIGIEESQAIAETIASGWIARSRKVTQFEQAFAAYVGAKHAVAVNSGTAALFIALKVLRSEKVVLPTYSCSALLNAIYMIHGTPVLWDIERTDFNANYKEWAFKENETLIYIHTFGVPFDTSGTWHNKPRIIEDCAQALGSYINNQHVGLQGDIGIFSFGPSKMITTGSGGMIVTNNDDLANKARDYIDYDKHVPAFNFAMNDLQATMGIEQLKKLPGFLKKRQKMAQEYIDVCMKRGWEVQRQKPSDDRNFYRFIVVDNFVDRLKQHLADNGITAIVPIKQEELLHNVLELDKMGYRNAEHISTHSLSLPIFPDLLDNGFDNAIKALRSF
jgi:dTDP-4-amino-4,6-dideoxygalactose transaminase